jgi:pimeloyl-ACP methyl ester carboxylesterase
MLAGEIKAAGKLAGDAVSHPAGLVRDVHRAVSGRVFGILGLIGTPTRVGHDAISTAVYRSVHYAIGALPRGGGAALAQLAPPDAASLAESTGGSLGLGALNGALGDNLAQSHNDLAIDLTVRHRGLDLTPDRASIERHVPAATGKLAVFLHGLCETDAAWHLLPLSGREAGRRSYGSRLRDERGYTPLYVRYNTGLHVSDNGSRLSDVLEELVAAWPTEVDEIVLVGHSMGGLVARSACAYGEAADHVWTDRVRHVFCLGSPHLGAPLEKAANLAGWALGRLPETQPFAQLVNARSAGIKDLRFGSCVEEDWRDCDPDEFLTDRCREVPFLASASYYFVGATVTRKADSPLGRLVGDLLVQFPSASGRSRRRRIPFELDNGLHLGGVNHIQLLNHPAVYQQIEAWMQRGAEPPAPAQA